MSTSRTSCQQGEVKAHSPGCGGPDNTGAGSRLGSNSEACLRPSYMAAMLCAICSSSQSDQPGRMTEMMAYQTIIVKASQRYRWPSWAIYDNTFRQEMVGTRGQSCARVDPSIYSLCFTEQAIGESWCGTCQTLDHTPQTCPARQAKRPWNMAFGGQQAQAVSWKGETCRRFNRNAGDCCFGKECCYKHSCSTCGGLHPASRCKARERPGRDGSSI